MISIHWKALLAALLLFGAGVAVGVAATAGFGLHRWRSTVREPAAAQARYERATERIERRLVEELALDPAQAAMVRRELARTGEELRSVRSDTVQRTRRVFGAAVFRIAAELPPEKRSEFRRLVARRLDRLGLDLPREPAPPPPTD